MFLLCPDVIFSQGVNIQSGAKMLATGAAIIKINNGNFENNGTYEKGAETVILSGSNASAILGNGFTSMNHLEITNSAGITSKIAQLYSTTLNIASGSKLTIDTASAITVTGSATNNVGVNGLVIKSFANAPNGSFIFHNAYESPVQATVEMYSIAAKSTTYKWQFFGIPLRSLVINPTFNGGYVRKFNEAGWNSGYADTNHWIQLQNGAVLTPFTGYEVTQLTEKKYFFSGTLENSSFSSGKLNYTSDAQYPGQHLIGNPFTSAIKIKKISFGSSDPLVMENTVYLYNSGSYADWQSGGAGANDNPYTNLAGQYTAVPQNVAGEEGIPSEIPSMQAFLIKVLKDDDAATLSIPYNSADTIIAKNTERQRVSAVKKVCTRIDVKGLSRGDRMWLFTESSCSEKYDNGWDGHKELGTSLSPQIFAEEEDGIYQINATNNIDNTRLGFKAGVDTEYTLTFTHTNSALSYPTLFLLDLQNGTTTDITESGTEYNFTATNTEQPETRFKIVTSRDISTEKSEIGIKGTRVFVKDKMLNIQIEDGLEGVVRIYDVAGQTVSSFAVQNNFVNFAKQLPDGVYFVSINTKSIHQSKKVIIH